jgi:hypothetical protein
MRIPSKAREAFRESAIRRSAEKIAAALRQEQSELTAPLNDDALTALCLRAVDRAKPYGFETEREVYAFASAMIVYGEQFDNDDRIEWRETLLLDQTVDSEIRARAIELRIVTDQAERGLRVQ